MTNDLIRRETKVRSICLQVDPGVHSSELFSIWQVREGDCHISAGDGFVIGTEGTWPLTPCDTGYIGNRYMRRKVGIHPRQYLFQKMLDSIVFLIVPAVDVLCVNQVQGDAVGPL